jgi:hypothetical protein
VDSLEKKSTRDFMNSKFVQTKTRDYQKLKLKDYEVGSSLRRFLMGGFILLMLVFVCFNLIIFKYWADYHVSQIFSMMNI